MGSEVRKAPLPSSRKRGLGLRANLDRLRSGRSGLRLFTLRLTAALALPVAALAVTVTHLSLGHERILVALSLVPLNAQLVVDVPDAGDRVENVLGQALRLPALDSPCEGHFTVLNPDLNPRGIQHAVMGQMLANILLDSGVAALIALWAAATVWPGHPASGSGIACSATAAFPALAMTAVASSTPASGLLLPPRAASTHALTATAALTPVAARTLLPIAPFTAVAFMRAHGT
jgi:hypothetical protein